MLSLVFLLMWSAVGIFGNWNVTVRPVTFWTCAFGCYVPRTLLLRLGTTWSGDKFFLGLVTMVLMLEYSDSFYIMIGIL
jgi:hypothetical protein